MWQTDWPTDRGIMWGLESRSMWLKFGKANQSVSVPMATRAFKSSKFSTWNTICLPDLVIRDKLGTTSTWGLAGNTLSLSIMYLLSSQSCPSDKLFGTSSENFLNILTSRFSFVGKPAQKPINSPISIWSKRYLIARCSPTAGGQGQLESKSETMSPS